MKTLKYAWRFLIRSKSYTLINLLGLAFSLACCIILMRYLHRELTVDTHCIDREQVYCICTNMEGSRGLSNLKQMNSDSVLIDNRHIKYLSRYIPLEKDYVTLGANRFPARCIVTDSVFFQLFHYPVVQGHLSLRTPQSALLTERFARKIFGKENPIGKVLRYANGKEILIEGILGEPQCKTTINFDIVLSSDLSDNWERMYVELYHFMPGTDMEEMNRIGSIPRYINPEYDTRTFTFTFISVKDIYWNSSLTDNEPSMFLSGNRSHIVILAAVCLLLLLTGILNFINIYLVVMLRRGKEYGLKKVFGVHGKTLFAQIWIENTLLISSALLIAWFMIEITVIPVENLFSYHFSYTLFDIGLSVGILILLPLITSIYPYAKYNYTSPILSIRSIGRSSRSGRSRMVFLSVQYILTFILIVLSLYFNRQLNVLLHTEPGFRTKNILTANLIYESKDFSTYTYEDMQERQQRVMQIDHELKACPLIETFEAGYYPILKLSSNYGTNYMNKKGDKVFLNTCYVTPNFFKLYNIKFTEGSLPGVKDNDRHVCIVANRAAMKALGYTSLQDAQIVEENKKRANANAYYEPIAGVVADYYGGHLSLGVQPTLYRVEAQFSGDLYQIAYAAGKKKEVIDFLRKLEFKVYGSKDFEYTLLEDDVKEIYSQDRQIAIIYSVFAWIAIFISSLGLFGISLFDMRQRYQEIAIRKVNGAGMRDLYLLLFRKYTVALVGAFMVAIPLASYIINLYTRDFAVKVPITVGIFVIALLIVLLISLGTLIWQIRKASSIDPVKIIKTE